MEKVERVDRVRNSLTESELYRQFPELELFGDTELEQQTADAFLQWCPEYFWEIPSSGTGKYHPPDEHGEYGNVIHTKRVFLAYEQLARSWTEQQLLTADEYHCGQAATLLHDMLKFGWPSDNTGVTVSDHDVIAARIVQNRTELPGEVAGAIAAHAGPFGDGPTPKTALQQVVHLADMSVSANHYYSDVFEPSDEIVEKGVGGDVEL